jgi:seryl-tRNA synthetase
MAESKSGKESNNSETRLESGAQAPPEKRALLKNASLTEQFVLDHPYLVTMNNEMRGVGMEINVDELARLIRDRRRLAREVDEYRHEINVIAKKGRDITDEERQRAREIRPLLKERETELSAVQEASNDQFSRLPNLTAPEVPAGGADENLTLMQVGEPRRFDFEPQSHVQIGETLDLLDMARAVKVVGKGFYYIKNELVLIRQALVTMVMKYYLERGFAPMMSPLLAKERTLYGTGYFPFAVGDSFGVTRLEGVSLIGTSEQTLVAQHIDELLAAKALPLKYVCDSACFRTEAGNYGKMTQGMLRVHQFHKVEQIIFCAPDESEHWQEEALRNEEWLLGQLELPYQVVLIACQDMGAPGYKKYDLEGWIPTQGKYVELTSNTNLSDFQTRRLNIRYRDPATGKTLFPHTISATAFSDRLLVALLENYQQADGSVQIPQALRPFLGGLTSIPAR